ncbi:AAA family ATPase [Defluviicoccus vanus]|uniref:AAA family ATPase n=1 Tax=Defluviicoccus vanus TaxID=111831 RepID=A0A7H1N3W1_9PROT|nr:AAA family ATPase [Defluviicoccus vanus]QNT70397.1 AAA family ATPase [Defluviicoccus vanus]
MYLNSVGCVNYGPLRNVDIVPTVSASGLPWPLVLLGPNGCGKTLLTSIIVDAVISFKKNVYDSIPEIEHKYFFQVIRPDLIGPKENFYLTFAEFIEGGAHASRAIYCRHHRMHEPDASPNDKVNKYFKTTSDEFRKTGNHDQTMLPEQMWGSIRTDIFLYFPPFRFEIPVWLNKETKIDMPFREPIQGKADSSIIQMNLSRISQSWIVDIFLDRELYEKQTVSHIIDGRAVTLLLGYKGRGSQYVELVNKLLTTALKTKFPDISYARLGVSRRQTRQVAIIIGNDNKTEYVYAPSFFHLSAGESYLLGLFISILREHDIRNPGDRIEMDDIKGIVIIDEADLHLHIKLQKETFAAMMKLFPRVQFIISTHSPLMILGMRDVYGEEVDFIELPSGTPVIPEEFSEFKVAYEQFLSWNEGFRSKYDTAIEKLRNTQKPLIITEGKTDWMHISAALSRFQSAGEFAEVDCEFLRYEESKGNADLLQMCRHLSKVRHNKPIICVFDREDQKILNEKNAGCETKRWSNEVFSIVLPLPKHRQEYFPFYTELYYDDVDLQRKDEENRRLYFTNEVEEVIRKQPGAEKTKGRQISILPSKDIASERSKKIYDKDVDTLKDADGKNCALSRTKFAELVFGRHEGFNDLDIKHFSVLFDQLRSVLQTFGDG